MKIFFLFLLSFIVLAETVVPCCLWDNCERDEMTSQPIEQKKDKSECSPFSACSTCVPGVVVAATSISVTPGVPLPIQHTVLPVEVSLSSYSSSLLQPPRLA